ncbi:glutamine synthetase family protein [Candidatus Epulonipiscium viviparus]|uniref:glutamine synthetase family protein n=1 Tax=Candidatus Epulonipiscium viviparus TaxID=420336 RepID=UPI00016C0450|nr:glutamine synthetase family protein [Candidatus Epulopiscium viviparus]
MDIMINDILNFVREHEVKFIRLAFCDIFGNQKNVAIMQPELEGALFNGVRIDGSKIAGFANEDLYLYPDPTTLCAMPWRPEPGCVIKFYCDIKTKDKQLFKLDSRQILKKAVRDLAALEYSTKIAQESEFYLFRQNDHLLPSATPIDNGSYLDVAPIDKGEDVRREICLLLDRIGITPHSSYHEIGPGQNQIDFKYMDALSCADNLLTFKSIAKAAAARYGLYASFMPKPIKLENSNDLNINISLTKCNKDLLETSAVDEEIEEYFMAGILEKAEEMALFLHPIINSYDSVVKIPFVSKNYDSSFKCRHIGSIANPYIAYSLILQAGILGIQNQYTIKKSVNLPKTLQAAIIAAKESSFVSNSIGEDFVKRFVLQKEREIDAYKSSSRETFYMNEYFLKL